MNKKLIYVLCISIVIIMSTIFCSCENSDQGIRAQGYRYEMINHGSSVLIFDKQTGDYWHKFFSESSGPTEWTKFESPIN